MKNESTPQSQLKRILIVEDDPYIAKALALRIEEWGYEAMVAPDAVLGLSSAVKNKPALALLDISLPAGNGFSIADRIQELLPNETPFIFVTASKQPGLREKARLLGAAGFFEKPFVAEELRVAIKGALSESQSHWAH